MEENILLLSCCAPCSCAVIKKMAEEKKNFSVVFYNPNIRPFSEYEKRRDENQRVCNQYGVNFIELEYDNEHWCQAIKGFENEPERGNRCSICFHLRLKKVMQYALENNFTSVASVLGVSRYKNLDQVNQMAEKASKEKVSFNTENINRTGWKAKLDQLNRTDANDEQKNSPRPKGQRK